MSDRSKIEWTDATWTPIRARCWQIQSDGSGKERIGWHCEHVSEGCRSCYAESINRRLGTGYGFKPGNLRGKPEYYGGGIERPEIFLDEKMLLAPLHWKKPRMIFVCSMTDLFGDWVKDEWIDKIFAVMALCPQHTFQVLTKRAERMREYMLLAERKRLIAEQSMPISCALAREAGSYKARIKLDHFSACFAGSGPFKNVWLGISAERQQEADERIPHLLQTLAAVRFVSLEPLLGPIDLTRIIHPKLKQTHKHDPYIAYDTLRGHMIGPDDVGLPSLDWVIVGGESGPRARPMHPQWARDLRDQCQAAGIAYFFKQWGEWAPKFSFGDGTGDSGWGDVPEFDGHERVGKRAAGRLLDGREHNDMPKVQP